MCTPIIIEGIAAGVHVGGVVHHRPVLLLQFLQDGGQLVERLALQLVAQRLVLRYGRKVIALQHSLNIQTCAAAEDRHGSPTPYLLVGIEEILLILEQVVLRARLADVYQMIGR